MNTPVPVHPLFAGRAYGRSDMKKTVEDEHLRQAVIAFEQSVLVAPDRPAPALPAFVGLLRAVGELTRFALGVALDADKADPIDLEPRILRAA